ncbi:hypothetical protein rosmuc_00690 [Roseovarius mucosus DSM 17069]|uniref:Peptidase propeptide and YPEB domain protein n=1 Tax=Roseovarius mucosus DSM 17069 TaxID=1288298 RepID=A0A0A0HQG5_9RHOB|nr:hypothetical protein [Roseovarius mucosus]KGM89206.1 hypothetical protein rosmuc_00690 [Roseovarius mucosus DSM 17069]
MIKTVMAGLSAVVLAYAPAQAQTGACAPRDMVVQRLADAYGETRQSVGLGANNMVVEVFASGTSGSWTITVTGSDGVTCLVASGQAYEPTAETEPKPGKGA